MKAGAQNWHQKMSLVYLSWWILSEGTERHLPFQLVLYIEIIALGAVQRQNKWSLLNSILYMREHRDAYLCVSIGIHKQ